MLQSTALAQLVQLTHLSIDPAEPASQATAAGSSCCLKGVCLPCGLNGRDHDRFDDLVTTKRRIAREETVYRSGDTFEFLCAVRSGTFKSVGLLPHGDEKVTGFHLPRDMTGLVSESFSSAANGIAQTSLSSSATAS